MFSKKSLVPFFVGWLVMAWILPPTKLLGGLSAKKA